jgi:hypothetical protein
VFSEVANDILPADNLRNVLEEPPIDLSQFEDRLYSPATLEGEALVAFTLFVQPNGDGVTAIQVNSKMSTHAYRRGSSGGLKTDRVLQCVSTGRWEANLLDSVRRLVKE